MTIWHIIPTRDRPDLLAALLTDIDPLTTVVVDTGDNAWVDALGVTRVQVEREPPNISRWWNVALDTIDLLVGPCDVAVLNDDLRIPPGTLETLSALRTKHSAAIAFPDVHARLAINQVAVLREARPHNLFDRMTGYCFLLDGSLGMRFDEELAWHYSDDDMEWRAALFGGVLQVGGTTVEHLHPSESTNGDPALLAQAGLDRERFIEKWGLPPW